MFNSKTPLISVIIPVYNVELYVSRCIKSIVNQSYTNLEIILIDDGSDDKSGKICDYFAKVDNRIVAIHKKNGGLSDARNLALGLIHGEWITFVDGDDWVHKDYVGKMLQVALERGIPIISSAFIATNKDMITDGSLKNKEAKIFDKETGIRNLLYQKYFTTAAWGKLFLSELWINIRFPYGKLYEDVEVIYRIFTKGCQSAYLNEKMYYYYARPDSIVRNKFTLRKMDYVENSKNLLDNVSIEFPTFAQAALSRLLWSEIHVLVHMEDDVKYKQEYQMLWSDIKQNRKKVIFDFHSRLINRVTLIITYGGSRLLKLIFKISRYLK